MQTLLSATLKRTPPSVATETRGLGSGKRPKAGDSSGLANLSFIVPLSPSDQTQGGGGTTYEQPGDKPTDQLLANVPLRHQCEHPELPSRTDSLHDSDGSNDPLMHTAGVDYAEVLPSRSQVFSPAIHVGPSGAGVAIESSKDVTRHDAKLNDGDRAKRPQPAMSSNAQAAISKRVHIEHKQPTAEDRLVSSSRPAEDRLASSSRALRRRISRKRPPTVSEGFAAKRQKLDYG